MMQEIPQLLYGVGFVLALQSSYIQGEYPLVMGFKPLPDVSTKCLPASAFEFTPPATLLGVPTPAFGRTKENETKERLGEVAVNDWKDSLPTCAQGGGTRDTSSWSKQNDKSEALKLHQVVPSWTGPSLLGPTKHYTTRTSWDGEHRA